MIQRTQTAADGAKFKKRALAKRARVLLKFEQRQAERVTASQERRALSMTRLSAPKRVSLLARVVTRVGSIQDEPVRAVPKEPRMCNKAVLELARQKPCLLLSPICIPNPETTVACHGAGVANGKGMAYKVGDYLTCWGCDRCNDYTDAYNRATAEQKLAVFSAGHARQIYEWQKIASDPRAKPRDRKASQWALDEWALSIARREAKNV
jgi:predicted Fe-S protein YdhL (DUF1289 family)